MRYVDVLVASYPSNLTNLVASQAFLPDLIDTPLLDPTRDEAKRASAFASLACIPALGTITNVGLRGVVPAQTLERVSNTPSPSASPALTKFLVQALKECFDACGQVHAVAKAALEESVDLAGPQ